MEIIAEKDYSSRMETLVCPVLKKYKDSGYFNPDGTGKIYYESYLRERAVGVVLIVHGFTESAEKYPEMIYYFFQAGYTIYIPDIRGHGRSARFDDDLSMVHIDRYEHYISDLEYLIKEIIKKENPHLPIYLYGHSMGGGICAALLEKQPDMFAKAILSSPMIRPLTGRIPFFAARLIAGLFSGLGRGKCYIPGQHGFRGDERFEDSAAVSRERYEYYYRKKLKEKLFQTSGASYGWLREAAGLSAYIMKKKNCRKIRAKVLLFQAQQDDYVDRRMQSRFAKQAEDVRLLMLEGTKHEIYMSHDDTMQEYIERILTFLEG